MGTRGKKMKKNRKKLKEPLFGWVDSNINNNNINNSNIKDINNNSNNNIKDNNKKH